MNSGVVTERENFSREERTSLFINLAGVAAQKAISSDGLSSHVLSKILANIIYDWHWLSFKYPEKFKFNGIGELRWIPNRIGPIGIVVPGIDYVDIKLHHGYFANLIDLFNSSVEYTKYGCTLVDRKLVFPSFIPFEILQKSQIEGQERHYWEELVLAYALLDETSLTALASCRNDTSAVHCLWIQFIVWKRAMGMAVDTLRQESVLSLGINDKNDLLEKFSDAEKCMQQIDSTIDHKKKMGRYKKRLEKITENTELHDYIPCEYEMLETSLADKYETFIELSAVFKDLHNICKDFQIHMGLISGQEPNYSALETRLKNIQDHLSLSGEIINANRWHSLFLQGDSKRDAARLMLTLIEASFDAFSRKLDLRFDRTSAHYQTFFEKYYPLPIDHFLRGN